MMVFVGLIHPDPRLGRMVRMNMRIAGRVGLTSGRPEVHNKTDNDHRECDKVQPKRGVVLQIMLV